MSDTCSCLADQILVFSCAGGSNVGQLANAAAVRLAQEGLGRVYCLAGIGAHIEGMVSRAREVQYPIAIDGCGVECARKALEHAGIQPRCHVVVTAAGIEKSHDLELRGQDIAQVADAVRAAMGIGGGAAVAGGCCSPQEGGEQP